MLPTHALGGIALGLAVGTIVPEFGGIALVAGLLGGIFPDLDLYAGHRKSLHYPVYYSVLAMGTFALAIVFPMALTVGAAVFVLGAALHSVADVFGGGLELRPWEATSERAVYDHFRGQWIAPRRWISYDGSRGDFLLSISLAIPLLIALDGAFQGVVIASVAVAGIYAAVRRILPDVVDVLLDEFVVPVLPDALLTYVPDRYRQTGDW